MWNVGLGFYYELHAGESIRSSTDFQSDPAAEKPSAEQALTVNPQSPAPLTSLIRILASLRAEGELLYASEIALYEAAVESKRYRFPSMTYLHGLFIPWTAA